MIVAFVVGLWFQVSAQAQSKTSEIQYPLVFTSTDDLARFGLSTEPHESLLHQCYYYGAGGQLIWVSHERLLRYRDMGFTLNSLCLGLISETLFDPETGRRLPTYIVAGEIDDKKIEDVDVTPEHPLEVPECFRRALIYADCIINYDRLTGARLPAEKTQAFRELGLALNQAFERAIERRLFCAWPFCVERNTGDLGSWDAFHPGSLAPGGGLGVYPLCANEGYLTHVIETTFSENGIEVPRAMLDEAHLSCFDVSINLPAGYGYTMDADGTASPFISPELLKAAIDPKRRAAQIDPEALAKLLKDQQGSAEPATVPHK